MTGVLIILGSISIIYGSYLHYFHRSKRSINSKNAKTTKKRNENSKTATTNQKPIQNSKTIGNKGKIENRKARHGDINIEEIKQREKPIQEEAKIIQFSEVLRENLSLEERQKDTLEKLKQQSITLEAAAKILNMNKGEVLLLKNIYVNYHQ